jgi:SnoaL-like protein
VCVLVCAHARAIAQLKMLRSGGLDSAMAEACCASSGLDTVVIICNNCGIALEDGMCFCSECGAEMLSGSRPMPSAQPRQPERDERKAGATLARARSPAAATTRLVGANTKGETRERYSTAQVAVMTIAIMLTVLFTGATVTWLVIKDEGEPAPRNASETSSLTKGTSASPTTSVVHGSPPTAAPTNASWEAEVAATLGGWVSALEAHDLDAHMSYFAETLDRYHSHRNVGAARVRADLARAFSRYSTLSLQLSGMRVTLDRNYETASVIFDKTWTFATGQATTGDKTWSGSVRQMVWLRRIEGRWRISGLKDI